MPFKHSKNEYFQYWNVLFLNIRYVFQISVNQNLMRVMYFGFRSNASNAGTSLYFGSGIFGASSGWTLTNLQATDRSSNEIALFVKRNLQ